MIGELKKLDRGEIATLKRLNDPERTHGKADMIFYRIAPQKLSPEQEECYRIVASLYGYNTKGGAGDMGFTLKKVSSSTQGGADELLTVLVNSTLVPGAGTITYNLRRAIMYADNKDIGVDWAQLLRDLQEWNAPDQHVQKKWMKNYYSREIKQTNNGV